MSSVTRTRSTPAAYPYKEKTAAFALPIGDPVWRATLMHAGKTPPAEIVFHPRPQQKES